MTNLEIFFIILFIVIFLWLICRWLFKDGNSKGGSIVGDIAEGIADVFD